MGDRHNIGIMLYPNEDEQAKEILWLYAHNGFWTDVVDGYAASLAHALDEARPRWGDYQYFNRIIILTLSDSIRGIGIGTATGDEHKRYVLDPKRQIVHLMDNWSWNGDCRHMPSPIVSFTYDEFVSRYRKHERTVRGEY